MATKKIPSRAAAAKSNPDGPIVGYFLRWTVVVDHPERRGPSLPKVKPYSIVVSTVFFPDLASAKRVRDGLLRGEEDFESEYVASVSVNASRQWRRVAERIGRTVRRERP